MPKYSLAGSITRNRLESVCRASCEVTTTAMSSTPSPLKSPVRIGKACASTNCGPNCANLIAQGAPEASTKNEVQAIISAQFGPQFVLADAFPILTGDFNGDGVEDIAVVVTSHDALQTDSSRFRVIDPASEYFGIGDPKITSQFASQYPGGSRYLLIIHGVGKEAWRVKEPKERFVVINVSFDRISIGHME